MPGVIDLAPELTQGLASPAGLAAAGAALARHLEAEAAALAHGLAGGLVLAALATRPGGRRIVLMKGHAIDLGGSLGGFLALAGAAPLEIGGVDKADPRELDAALDGAAAALYVADARLRGGRLMELPLFCHRAFTRGVPVIVLAMGMHDWRGLLDAGADLLVLDAAVAFAGPPLGIVVGRTALVEEARLSQETGLGRLGVPGPEQVTALLSALERPRADLDARRARIASAVAGRPGLVLAGTASGAALAVEHGAAGFAARDLAHALRAAEPAVIVDDRRASSGVLGLDLVRADEADLDEAAQSLGRLLAAGVPPAPWP